MQISEVAKRVTGQPMFKVLAKAQAMPDIIHFELGDPDFDTPIHIVEATYKSLRNGDTHYVNSTGIRELKDAIIETTSKTRRFTPAENQVLVTPGANIIIYLAMVCITNPGDEVVIPNPGFPTYSAVANMLGLKITDYPTPNTKLIVINSPSNPTGKVMSPTEIFDWYQLAIKYNCYLLSDEVYSRMIYDNNFLSVSTWDKCQNRVILMNGFSKAFAMTGFRLGVAIGPEDIISKMGLIIQTLCSCVPPFIQKAGVAAITGDQQETIAKQAVYKKRRDILVAGLNRIKGITCELPQGAFYAFPNITGTGMTSQEFADYMLEHGVALLPGTDFGSNGEGYVRISYSTDLENIVEGLKRIDESLRLRG